MSPSRGVVLRGISGQMCRVREHYLRLGPSGRETDAIDSEVIEEVDSEVHAVGEISPDDEGVQPVIESQQGEGMLLNNPKSSVSSAEVKLWRYLYKIPSCEEIRVSTAHKRVD